MPAFDHHLYVVSIRWLHVFAMALLLGGAVLFWGLSLGSPALDRSRHSRVLLTAAARYEWLFWGAIGVLAFTGVGNLAAFGDALPQPQSVWGGRLAAKLSIVLAVIVLSVLRTALIGGLHAAADRTLLSSGWKAIQDSYAGTALLLATVLGLAVFLAHG